MADSQQVQDWSVENGKLTRNVKVKNFGEALALVNRVGELAEAENHHPDICIHSWNQVKIELYTHTQNAISDADYQLARKINGLMEG
ncbi:MAG: 4a-hydroxytetrahydrobiopterin dehydratase [Chloroflexota bacterium]